MPVTVPLERSESVRSVHTAQGGGLGKEDEEKDKEKEEEGKEKREEKEERNEEEEMTRRPRRSQDSLSSEMRAPPEKGVRVTLSLL